MCKSKIHRLTVTDVDLHYEGSLTLDRDLMEAADLVEGEKVQVVNVNNGARFETYAMTGSAGSGMVRLNGAAARLGQVGDIVIVIAYAGVPEEQVPDFRPRVVLVRDGNRVAEVVKAGR